MPPLVPGWVIVDGLPVYHRCLCRRRPGSRAIVHVHGFGISGTYLEPTAARLAPRHRTYVPDLPGMGRSHRPDRPLDVVGPCPSARLVLRHGGSRAGDVCRQLVGLPDHHRGGDDVSRPHRASRVGVASRGSEQPAVTPRALADGGRRPPRTGVDGADRRSRLPPLRHVPGLVAVQGDDPLSHARACRQPARAHAGDRRQARPARAHRPGRLSLPGYRTSTPCKCPVPMP